ncbi:MAG: hypothetical protein ACREM9_11655 [Gemmatimonadales bacterium]
MEDAQPRRLPEHPVEELAPQTYCQRAALELAALIRHQSKPRRGTRRDSALLRRCIEQVLGSGAARVPAEGPWHAASRPLKRPGRGGLKFIPLVTRGGTTVMVSTPREAEELAAFLNFCGTQEMGA